MARSRKILTLDERRRITLGSLAGAHDMFFAHVDERGIITLTPAELVPVAQPKPRKRAPRRKSVPEAASRNDA